MWCLYEDENGMRGGNEYANQAKRKGEQHIFALESDSGHLHLEIFF